MKPDRGKSFDCFYPFFYALLRLLAAQIVDGAEQNINGKVFIDT